MVPTNGISAFAAPTNGIRAKVDLVGIIRAKVVWWVLLKPRFGGCYLCELR
jgi:hypothetical protein